MRIALIAAIALALLAPAAASANQAARCRHLSAQIAHFEAMSARADQLGNELWVERFDDQLALLEQRRKSCPSFSDSEIAARQLQELLRLAARGALTFFTLGMAPF